MRLNIIFPVYNEERRLERGIRKCMGYMRRENLCPFTLTIVDNASSDSTGDIGRALEEEFTEVRYERISEKGVGAAFRRGIALNEADIVGYMDIDLSTDLSALKRTVLLFKKYPSLSYVNGTRFHKDSRVTGRKPLRRFTSLGLRVLLKLAFNLSATDAVCGFTFVRAKAAARLVNECYPENGWFYTIEFLIRAEKDGMRIKDLPVRWREDHDTTVNVGPTIINYLKQTARLRLALIKEKKW